MENIVAKNIVFRRLNENDKDLFVNLRLIFLMDCFNEINKTDKEEI